jgi:hypothetical protein
VLTMLSHDLFVRYMNRDLRSHLRGDGIDFNRDWAKLTNAEAVDILRHAVGGILGQPCTLQHGYVLTVDTLLKVRARACACGFLFCYSLCFTSAQVECSSVASQATRSFDSRLGVILLLRDPAHAAAGCMRALYTCARV